MNIYKLFLDYLLSKERKITSLEGENSLLKKDLNVAITNLAELVDDIEKAEKFYDTNPN